MVLTTASERACEAWRALGEHCLRRYGDALLAMEGPGRMTALAPLWPFSQVLAAAVEVAAIDGDLVDLDAFRRGLERYRIKDAYGPNPGAPNRYYDDNCWIALDLLRLFAITGERRALGDAVRVFGFIAEGEARDDGVWWVEHPKASRHTCSTAPGEQVALLLHRATGQGLFRSFAERCDTFLDRHLRAPSGLYWDNIDNKGRVEKTHWSYNQGTPIGADVIWHELTGDDDRLRRASQTADAALDHYSADDGLWKQPAAFNGVFFRGLLDLYRHLHDPRHLDSLDGYLERAWIDARNPRNGLLLGGGIGRYEGGGTIDHAALVQLYALRAQLA